MPRKIKPEEKLKKSFCFNKLFPLPKNTVSKIIKKKAKYIIKKPPL